MTELKNIRPGEKLPELEVKVGRDEYMEYNKLVGNINPLHSDDDYARALGFRGIVVAGVYTYGFVTRLVEEWCMDWGRVSRVQVRYHNPLYLDEKAVHRGRVKDVFEKGCEVSVEVIDSSGQKLTEALVRVDSD